MLPYALEIAYAFFAAAGMLFTANGIYRLLFRKGKDEYTYLYAAAENETEAEARELLESDGLLKGKIVVVCQSGKSIEDIISELSRTYDKVYLMKKSERKKDIGTNS